MHGNRKEANAAFEKKMKPVPLKAKIDTISRSTFYLKTGYSLYIFSIFKNLLHGEIKH